MLINLWELNLDNSSNAILLYWPCYCTVKPNLGRGEGELSNDDIQSLKAVSQKNK
jgi:hypothetical protein